VARCDSCASVQGPCCTLQSGAVEADRAHPMALCSLCAILMIRGLFDKSSLDSVAPATLPVLKGPGAVAPPLAQVDLVMHSPDLGRQIARVAES